MSGSVTLRNVWLRYPRVSSQHRRLLTPATWRKGPAEEGRWALSGLDLDLQSGDRVALIGRNGAGKTTLLRVLAGIYAPQRGDYLRHGRVACLLDTGYGLDPNVSARRNAVSRAIISGLPRREALTQAEAALDFAGLTEVADDPIRTFSMGMMARLIFSISTQTPHDILVLDEAIGAGDAAFQARAQERIASLLESASVVVCASHSRDFLASFCSEAVYIDGGRCVARGPFVEVHEKYETDLAST